MMLYEYEHLINKKTPSELDVFCKMEGLNPLYVQSAAKTERQPKQPKRIIKAIGFILKEIWNVKP